MKDLFYNMYSKKDLEHVQVFFTMNYFTYLAKRDFSREALFFLIKPFEWARSIAEEAILYNSAKLSSPAAAAFSKRLTAVR